MGFCFIYQSREKKEFMGFTIGRIIAAILLFLALGRHPYNGRRFNKERIA
jgi:hypothetical protein